MYDAIRSTRTARTTNECYLLTETRNNDRAMLMKKEMTKGNVSPLFVMSNSVSF